ncbi:hypothetical protein [Streptomyces virginiae]|uniref:hypothetical protein n=1 Tax=Streptomyces virginiae TaxID=1961 RepID=UPI002DD80085|nr:hypothetical protein [Streptomyces virginiae]WSC79516.1 hypothetical protein OHA56_26125 [Streptomyces virginiae]
MSTSTHAAPGASMEAGRMNQGEWKPAGYRRRTERVGTVVVAVAGALMAAGAVFTASVLLVYVCSGN